MAWTGYPTLPRCAGCAGSWVPFLTMKEWPVSSPPLLCLTPAGPPLVPCLTLLWSIEGSRLPLYPSSAPSRAIGKEPPQNCERGLFGMVGGKSPNPSLDHTLPTLVTCSPSSCKLQPKASYKGGTLAPAVRFNQCRLFTERNVWGWALTPSLPTPLGWLTGGSEDGAGRKLLDLHWGQPMRSPSPQGPQGFWAADLLAQGCREAEGTEPAVQYHFPQQPRLLLTLGRKRGRNHLHAQG